MSLVIHNNTSKWYWSIKMFHTLLLGICNGYSVKHKYSRRTISRGKQFLYKFSMWFTPLTVSLSTRISVWAHLLTEQRGYPSEHTAICALFGHNEPLLRTQLLIVTVNPHAKARKNEQTLLKYQMVPRARRAINKPGFLKASWVVDQG